MKADSAVKGRWPEEDSMVAIIHRVGIRAPAAKVYKALATVEGVAGWWTKDATGDSRVGGTTTFRFYSPAGEQLGTFEMKVIEMVPDKKVRWLVEAGPEEWVGTDIEFAISEADGQTIVLFGHHNWREAVEFMAHCSMKWATFLLSLRELVETGTGRPSPDDLKIDNWN
jgi:uncharacterized protein YndB with AHSA1/START domain